MALVALGLILDGAGAPALAQGVSCRLTDWLSRVDAHANNLINSAGTKGEKLAAMSLAVEIGRFEDDVVRFQAQASDWRGTEGVLDSFLQERRALLKDYDPGASISSLASGSFRTTGAAMDQLLGNTTCDPGASDFMGRSKPAKEAIAEFPALAFALGSRSGQTIGGGAAGSGSAADGGAGGGGAGGGGDDGGSSLPPAIKKITEKVPTPILATALGLGFAGLGFGAWYLAMRQALRMHRSRRQPCSLDCFVDHKGRVEPARMVDLAMAGTKLRTALPHPVGTRLRIVMPGMESEARVIWANANYMGLAFTQPLEREEMAELLRQSGQMAAAAAATPQSAPA